MSRPDTRPLFLGRKTEELGALIETQIAPIFLDFGIRIPVRSCSLMVVIEELGSASAADVSKQLGQSHQLVMQKLPALIRLGFLRDEPDPNDRRRKVLKLTRSGLGQMALLEKHAELIEQAYADLNEELGVDVYPIVVAAIKALEGRSLAQRVERYVKGGRVE